MKVLFAAFRRDPRRPSAASGAEYQFYRALEARGLDLELLSPLPPGVHLVERVASAAYKTITGASYLKFKLTPTLRASRDLDQAVAKHQPDVVLTLFPAALVFYSASAPAVYRLDTSFRQLQQEGPEFLTTGKLALRVSLWQERRAFERCARVVTHSARSREDLITNYDVPPKSIDVFPNPAALPTVEEDGDRQLDMPVELLFVGREPRRKGLDIAEDVVGELNHIGIPARLTVCGMEDEERPHVRFAGMLDKSDPSQLAAYLEHYRRAHFLLHPARFDPSPMVTSEAAAFGLPTLTNDNGGLPTAVTDGESGIVLPRRSGAEEYVRVILKSLRHPESYREMRRSTRLRYLRELNWSAVSPRLIAALERAARPTRSRR